MTRPVSPLARARLTSFAVAGGMLALRCRDAAAGTPMSYLTSAGSKADTVLPLTDGVLAISAVVVVVICALVLAGTLRRRGAIDNDVVHPDASAWLYVGVGVSTLVLVVALLWTIRVLAFVNAPAQPTALTISVTGQQWWWDVRYLDNDASRIVRTANEIHIPVGVPVRIELHAADVIHSFWIPKLGGKTDAIPGQTNTTWIEAREPGRYLGQCAEYCGMQHAHMALVVVAEPRETFESWRTAQISPAPAPAASTPAERGEHAFEYQCGACHTVRGTLAGGTAAPDLTHLMSRQTIAAGALENTPGNLAAWIANPQAIKPGNHMPTLGLAGPEIGDIQAYLTTLK